MLLFKLFLISFYFCQISGSESSEELKEILSNPVGASILKKAIADAYNEDKLASIADLINNLKDDIQNITLVGSQNIHGPEGDIVEIRTVELHLPVDNKIKLTSLAESNDENDDDYSLFDMKNTFDMVSLLGFDLSIEGKEFDSHGKLTDHIFINKDITYQFDEGVHLVNNTLHVDSLAEVDNDIEALKQNNTRVSVHKYDEENNLLTEKSEIYPELSSKINTAEGTYSQQLLDDILRIVTVSLLKYGDDHKVTPGKIVEALTKKYPKNNFYAIPEEPTAWWLADPDYGKISVEHDLALFYQDDSVIYYVFVTKKP